MKFSTINNVLYKNQSTIISNKTYTSLANRPPNLSSYSTLKNNSTTLALNNKIYYSDNRIKKTEITMAIAGFATIMTINYIYSDKSNRIAGKNGYWMLMGICGASLITVQLIF